MAVTLKNFVEQIYTINPTFINAFGTGLPGMTGSAISVQGANTSGSDVITQLRHETSTFAELVSHQASNRQIHQSAQTLEGQLLTLQTLSQISGQLAARLIDELHDLAN